MNSKMNLYNIKSKIVNYGYLKIANYLLEYDGVKCYWAKKGQIRFDDKYNRNRCWGNANKTSIYE